MKTAKVFNLLNRYFVGKKEESIIEDLETSFIDLSPEGSSDYISIDDYFQLVKGMLSEKRVITSEDVKTLLIQLVNNNQVSDLFVLDGLDGLVQCLVNYGGQDDLDSFKKWLLDVIDEATK